MSPDTASASASTPTLADLVAGREVLVCVGTGGVGKTTTAAALGVAGARAGRRTAVVTVDPARRLASALGLDRLSNHPAPVPGPWDVSGGGSLSAMMLDSKSTFDELIARYARTTEQYERILGNRFYQNVSGGLSGTHEYMAMEKLYELHDSGNFDLLVVDTPPSREALAFLDAPNLLARLLENRLYRVITAPGRGAMKVVNSAAQSVLKQLSRIVGAEVVEDAVTFFQAFEGMEDGFKNRTLAVLELLGSPRTAFVLVASPRRDTLAEATWFADQLAEGGMQVQAAVVNRMTPRFVDEDSLVDPAVVDEVAVAADAARAAGDASGATALAELAQALRARASEEGHVATLEAALPGRPVLRIDQLDRDIADLDGLEAVADQLV